MKKTKKAQPAAKPLETGYTLDRAIAEARGYRIELDEMGRRWIVAPDARPIMRCPDENWQDDTIWEFAWERSYLPGPSVGIESALSLLDADTAFKIERAVAGHPMSVSVGRTSIAAKGNHPDHLAEAIAWAWWHAHVKAMTP